MSELRAREGAAAWPRVSHRSMGADESSKSVHLTILPPQPTLDEIEDLVRQMTGKPMTPEDRAETQRLLDDLAARVAGA